MLALVALGCDDKKPSSTNNGAPASSSAEAVNTPPPAVPDAGRPPREPRPQGPAAPLFTSVRAVELKDDQKEKVTAAEKTAAGDQEQAQQDAIKDAAKNLYTELAAQVKAGKIDAAKVTPLYAPIEATTKPRLEAEAEGLNQLHAALTPEQRKALTADLRKKDAQREEHLTPPGDGGAKMISRSDVHHIERLGKELELDDEQKGKVGAFALKDDGKEAPAAAKRKKANEALYEAFEKDTFDAKKLELFAPKSLTEAFDDETKFIAKLVPVLKQEQRDKLAARVEKGWPLYDRANPFLRARLGAMMPGRMGPGSLKGGMSAPGKLRMPGQGADHGEGVPH